MSQNDLNIANQGFPSFRSDLNSALQALASTSSGDTEPATTYANQLWYDTATNVLKIRNEANSAWLDALSALAVTATAAELNQLAGVTLAAGAEAAISADTDFTVDTESLASRGTINDRFGVANAQGAKDALNATGSAPIYATRAWGNFNGDALTTRGSGNLSIARTSTGNFTFTMATAMPDVNYSVNVSCNAVAGAPAIAVNVLSATQFSINVRRASNEAAGNPTEIFIQVVR